MSWINEVTDVLQRYRNAPASTAPDSAPADFAKVAQHAPPAVISSGLAEAFRSPSTPPFSQMVSQLFGQSDTGQRAGILNHLIAAAGPAALSGGLLGSLTGALSGPRPSITPEQAQQVDPAAVRQLAEHAQKQDPSIVDRAGEFYAQHPKLVQGLGAAALALVMSHVSQRH